MRGSPIPMAYRVIYIVLLFLPTIKFNYLFLPCLVLFYSIAALSLGFTFMPTEMSYYLYLSIFMAIVGCLKTQKSFPGYPILLFSFLWVFITSSNVINSSSFEKISYSLLCFIFLFIIASVNKQDIQRILIYVPFSFIIASFTGSVLLLVNREFFIVQAGGDYERLMTASINYSCTTIGIGSVMAFMHSLRPSNRLPLRLLCLTSFGVSIVALLMLASRGALLSVSIACLLILFFSRVKTGYKIFGVLFIVLFALILYQNNSFDLLIYRIQEDDGTGSNRLDLWALKLASFRELDSNLEYIFGIGLERALHLGQTNNAIYLHNDFLAFFIEYGLVGLGLFVLLLVYPLLKVSKSLRITVLPFLAFIVTTSLLLEPFAIGFLPIFFLLLYVYLLAFAKDSIRV